jgi:maleate cis-trans isomerase
LISLRGQVLALQRSVLCQDFMVILNLLTSQLTEEKDSLFINFTAFGTFCAITDIKRRLESRTYESTAHTFWYDRGLTLFQKVKE